MGGGGVQISLTVNNGTELFICGNDFESVSQFDGKECTHFKATNMFALAKVM